MNIFLIFFIHFFFAQGVIFPVVLNVDGHKSHLTYQLSVLYNKLKIEIIALYPNTTIIQQPADVAVFRRVKIFWRKAVRDWHARHPGEILNKVTFAPLLREVIDFAAKHEKLVTGFQACGLYPLNTNAVNYIKHPGEILNKMRFAPLLREVIDLAAKHEKLVTGFQASGLYPLNTNAVDYIKHPGEILNKMRFAPLLREVIDFAAKHEKLVTGFQACGLYSLNANAVDYVKCLSKNITMPTNEKIDRQGPSAIQRN